MTEQISVFYRGGFVVHRVYIGGSKCRFSAWYDENGNFLDGERIDARNRAMPATPAQREALAKLSRGFVFRAYGR